MLQYRQYSKAKFDYELRSLLIRNRAGFVTEIEHGESWEHIYQITTKNPAINIIMFTSIDKRTGKTRNNGADRVRLVMAWTNRSGQTSYKRLARHNRIHTLFSNIESTLLNAKVFNVELTGWSKKLPL
jgi:hypothetical protein